MMLFLCLMQVFAGDYSSNISLVVDMPKTVPNEDTVVITAILSNESEKNITFYELLLSQSLFRGDKYWNIKITKNGKRYSIPQILFRGTKPPKRIRLKKHSSIQFQIPISLKELTIDDSWIVENTEDGHYQLQLSIILQKPKRTKIESNIINFHLKTI